MSSTTVSQSNQTELRPLEPKLPLPSKIPRPPKKLPYIDLSIPGTPVSSQYVIAWKAQQEKESLERSRHSPQSSVAATVSSTLGQANAKTKLSKASESHNEQTTNATQRNQNKEDQSCQAKKPNELSADPFEAFLESMNKLKSDRLKDVDSKDILDLFFKLENAARARDEIDNDDEDDGYRSVDQTYGYANIGMYSTRTASNLNMFSLNFLNRRSSNQGIGGSYFYSPTLSTEYRRKSRELSANGNDQMPVMKNFQSLRRSISNLERHKEIKKKYERGN